MEEKKIYNGNYILIHPNSKVNSLKGLFCKSEWIIFVL
jgi:hypothetical protein